MTAISQDRRGRLWLGTYKKGLFGFTPGLEEKKISLSLPGDDPQGRETIISALLVDKDQVLWIGTDRGLVCLRYRRRPVSSAITWPGPPPAA